MLNCRCDFIERNETNSFVSSLSSSSSSITARVKEASTNANHSCRKTCCSFATEQAKAGKLRPKISIAICAKWQLKDTFQLFLFCLYVDFSHHLRLQHHVNLFRSQSPATICERRNDQAHQVQVNILGNCRSM